VPGEVAQVIQAMLDVHWDFPGDSFDHLGALRVLEPSSKLGKGKGEVKEHQYDLNQLSLDGCAVSAQI
jgi:hypothetical protein